MSGKIDQLWQCNFCSAYFASNELLQLHFNEYRSRAAEAARCLAHANANAGEDFEHCSENEYETPKIRKDTCCPYTKCNRLDPFTKGQRLRVHFRQHVECEEVCVFCFKVFRVASEYIRHARGHSDAIEEKTTYTNKRCQKLVIRADQELMARLREADEPRGKKRTQEEITMDSDATSSGLILPHNLHSIDPPLVSMRLPNNAGQIGPLIPIQDDNDFTPSLFFYTNFVQYPPSIDPSTELVHVAGIEVGSLQQPM
ncbi:hypothetical protein F5X99DRAFT_422023 [Biscogniauxia marginata]|nr:hypothetical protein F5X99DRAFT_422023 [Biscogniauxia marginata]